VIVLQSLMPEAQLSDVIIALAGDLAMVAVAQAVAVPHDRPGQAAGGALGRRVAAAGAGHAGEPGRVRVRRHGG
jgi:hypothetical protein